MRGKDEQQLDVCNYISPEQRVPQDHPLRSLCAMTDEALRGLQPHFNKLYAKTGRPSIAPEKLLRALLLQELYSVRSEPMLMEQLDYNLLFRWFVGLNMDDSVWDVTVFTKNRERLLDGDIAEASSPSGASASTRAESALGRALYGGRNAVGSVGKFEEFSAKGCQVHGSAGRSWQRDSGFPPGEALERDA